MDITLNTEMTGTYVIDHPALGTLFQITITGEEDDCGCTFEIEVFDYANEEVIHENTVLYEGTRCDI